MPPKVEVLLLSEDAGDARDGEGTRTNALRDQYPSDCEESALLQDGVKALALQAEQALDEGALSLHHCGPGQEQ